MSRRIWLTSLTIVILAVVVTACSSQDDEATPDVASATPAPTTIPTVAPPTATPVTEPVFNLARVDSLEILTGDSSDNSVTVRLRGGVSNGCARVGDIITELENDLFTIAVMQVQDPAPPDSECVEEEIPFAETVELIDLAPGSYRVTAHGLQGTFTVEAMEEADADPVPTVPASASGRVWHDLCLNSGDPEGELPDGCVNAGEGGLRANGIPEDEPGIAGVRVGIAAGDCDAPATEFSITGTEGDYTFDDLLPGDYCVTVDSSSEQNQELLLTGVWTSPQGGVAEQSITIEDSSGQQGIDFGWDFEFLPLGEFDPETCENSLAYIEDINIPDDTEFAPGQAFTKRWLLRNNGTCPWTTEYSVIFVGGDRMSAPESLPLNRPVVPGQTLEVAINMVAPTETGAFRGNWQVADPSGEPFGIDGFIEDAFWLRIVVSTDATPGVTPSADSGTIGGVVWEDFCFNSDPGSGCLEFPEGSDIYIANGTYDRLESALGEITITLASRACPSDGSLPTGASVLSTTTTGDDGLYRFENLDTGMYCIFMDALSDENVDYLIPGNWTWPATGVGRYTFFLDPGEQALDLDFGWEYVD